MFCILACNPERKVEESSKLAEVSAVNVVTGLLFRSQVKCQGHARSRNAGLYSARFKQICVKRCSRKRFVEHTADPVLALVRSEE